MCLVPVTVHWKAFESTVMNPGVLDVGKFSDQLRKCQVLMDSALWRWNSARILGKDSVLQYGNEILEDRWAAATGVA